MKLSTIIKVFFVLTLLIIISIIGVLSALDLNKYKAEIIEAVKQETGRTLTIDGDLHFAFSLVPTIVVEKAALSNAEWGSKPEMVSLDKFELELAIMPLFNNVLQINKLILLNPDILLETNKQGKANWAFAEQDKTHDDNDGHDDIDMPLLFLQNVAIENANIVYLDGLTGQKTIVEVKEISAKSDSADSPLKVLFDMAYNQVPINVKGDFGSINLLTSNSPFPFDLAMSIADTQAKLQGQIKHPMDGKGLDLDIDVKAKSLAWLSAIANSEDVPTVTDVDLTATLNEQDSALNVNMVYNQQTINVVAKTGAVDALTDNKPFPIDVDITIADIVAAITGKLDKPLDVKGLDITVSAKADTLAGLSAIAGQELPEMTGLDLVTTLTEQASELALNLSYNQQPVSVKGQLGPIEDLLDNEDFTIDLAASIAEAQATVKGEIEKPLEGKGLDLAVALQVEQFEGLAAIAQTELPPLSAVDLVAKVNEDASSLQLTFDYLEQPVSLDAKLGALDNLIDDKSFPIDVVLTAANAKALIKGELEHPLQAKGVAVDVSFNTASLTELSTVAETSLPDIGAVDFVANLQDSEVGYSISGMSLNAANTDLAGDVIADLSADVPFIQAKLSSQLIDISAFGGEEQQAEADQTTGKSDRIFSDEPLVLDGLKSVNADISISAKQITTSRLNLTDTELELKLSDGKLLVKPLRAIIAGGQLAGDLTLTNKGKLSTALTVKDLQPDQIADMSDEVSGAVTDVDIKLDGEGASIRQVMAGLDGHLTVKVGKGELTDSVLGTLGTDALNMLNPFSGDSDKTLLECSVVNFRIKDGIATADEGIAVSTEQMNIIGNGTINLKDETLDIDIKSEPKEGLGLSAGKFASLIKIGGTLADPSPETDLGGALGTGASVGAALATGGLSLLAEGLLDRATADANPCDTALDIKPEPVE